MYTQIRERSASDDFFRRRDLCGHYARNGAEDPGGVIAAGNASQFLDGGASACIVINGKLAEQSGLQPLGIFRSLAIAGCEPDEMGIGLLFAVPRLLERAGVKLDVSLWKLNEAFAVQVLYCRDKLRIPDDRLNVNGGAIAV
jgi:acetyl-CoA C-acetyltransferase